MPKNEPITDNKIVKMVPLVAPKARDNTLRLKEIIIASGKVGNIASKNGSNIPINGASHI